MRHGVRTVCNDASTAQPVVLPEAFYACIVTWTKLQSSSEFLGTDEAWMHYWILDLSPAAVTDLVGYYRMEYHDDHLLSAL